MVICFSVSGYTQSTLLTYSFSQKSTKNSIVTVTKSIDSSPLQSFNVFHENDSLIRYVFLKGVLYKQMSAFVEMQSKDFLYTNAIPYQDYFSLKLNSFATYSRDSFLIDFYINSDDKAINILHTNIHTGDMRRQKIAKIGKNEHLLCTKWIQGVFYILLYTINTNTIRVLDISKEQVLKDIEININAKDFRTAGNNIATMGNKLGHTLEKTIVMEESNDSKSAPLFLYDSEYKAYIRDSILELAIENGLYKTNIFCLNFVQHTVTYKEVTTALTIPIKYRNFSNRTNILLKNYLVNMHTINDGGESVIQMDIYDTKENILANTIKMSKSFFEKDSILYTEWKKGVQTGYEKYPFASKFSFVVQRPLLVKVQETDSCLYFQFGVYKVVTPAWKILLSLATSLAGTYFINSLPNYWGYSVFIFYGSQHVKEYTFNLKYNLKSKKLESIPIQKIVDPYSASIIKIIQEGKSSFQQFNTIETEKATLLGYIDNRLNQFKVIALN
jgi:hypothetical protein